MTCVPRFLRVAAQAAASAVCMATLSAAAQGTLADYQRARDLQEKGRDVVINTAGQATWIENTDHFWYTRTVKGGTEFILADASARSKKPAFDHASIAASLSQVMGHKYTALTLPFAPRTPRAGARPVLGNASNTAPLTFVDGEKNFQFGMRGTLYTCVIASSQCSKVGPIPQPGAEARPASEDVTLPSPEGPNEDPVDGLAYQPLAPQAGDGGSYSREPHGCAPHRADPQARRPTQNLPGRSGVGSSILGQLPAEPQQTCDSFDGNYQAFIRDHNVYVRPKTGEAFALSTDGSDENAYTFRTIAWSPDSHKLVAYHVRPGFDRQVHYIESSPADQVQPRHSTVHYTKPGDTVDIAYPVLFDVAGRTEINIDPTLFPNAFSLTPPVWWKDSRAFTFEYNARGHQAYTVIEADGQTGKTRPLIAETTKTFFYYNNLGPGLSAGRHYRHDVNDGKEIIWASERDGWEHLYLYDGTTGQVKNQITRGNWLVRNVEWVDDSKRLIYFDAGGSVAGQDPYFTQLYRVNFDGTGLKRMTEADGMHAVTFSPDHKYFVDQWQRIDLAPVSELRRTDDESMVMKLETADASALRALGVPAPEVFIAKARDGVTDIWGTITKPTNFDSHKKYPVIENIYAGPQGSFVPKTFSAVPPDQSLAELGFVVVHIDGMGTSNRSKAFHDVAFKNLGDAGFPDRILWHKAAAAKFPWYDISRVGIFGTSAGGQSSLGGVLFHPEFYKVVVTNSGCHDNRMDKLWWNEQWMSWPIGPEYAAASNVVNAYRLQGHALIIAGELDTNVDPASSLQVVNALIKAHKHFDMMYVPGQNHGVASLAAEHYRDDYFVHHLLGVEPPDWNKVALQEAKPEPEEEDAP